jgi:DOMON domain
MKTSLFLSWSLIGFFILPITAPDPKSYFGGANHDAYTNWVDQDLNVSQYPHSVFLGSDSDESLGVAVHYRLDSDENMIHLALAARASGWFGFGLSENGGMSGSDIFIFEAKNPDKVMDAYILDNRQPIPDDCASNWILKSAKEEAFDDGFLMIEVSRALDTGDLQDHRVYNDSDTIIAPHRLIAAWGEEPSYGYHGLVNRARGAVRWFDDNPDGHENFTESMEKKSYLFFEFRAMDYLVPPIETEYAMFCIDYRDLIEMGVPSDLQSMSMVAFEAIVDPRSKKHVQ